MRKILLPIIRTIRRLDEYPLTVAAIFTVVVNLLLSL
jgi:hypothetical protein